MIKRTEHDAVASHVNVLLDGRSTEAVLTRWDESPENGDEVKLRLRFSDRILEVRSDRGYFQALVELRRQLEQLHATIECNGASLNIYPSPMIQAMGYGDKAYKLSLGAPAKLADLVNIFELDSDFVASTVVSQQEFYEQWLKSLRP